MVITAGNLVSFRLPSNVNLYFDDAILSVKYTVDELLEGKLMSPFPRSGLK